MKWHKVRLDDEEVAAADCLGGVVVKFNPNDKHPLDDPSVYVPGYRINFRSGDADHNVLEKIEPRPKQFVLGISEVGL